jgi:hypothetical protein
MKIFEPVNSQWTVFKISREFCFCERNLLDHIRKQISCVSRFKQVRSIIRSQNHLQQERI